MACRNDKIRYVSGDTIRFRLSDGGNFALSEVGAVRVVNANGAFVEPQKSVEGETYAYEITSEQSQDMTLGEYHLEIEYGTTDKEIIKVEAFDLMNSTYKN